MDVFATSESRQASLPPLSMTNDGCRRDSLSSSRTRDSGYNSDLDVALLPLDYAASDPDFAHTHLPTVPEFRINGKSALLKKHFDLTVQPTAPQPNITSNPLGASSLAVRVLRQRGSSSTSRLQVDFNHSSQHFSVGHNKASQDEEIEKWIKDNLPSRNRPEQRVLSITSLSSTSSCDMYTSTDISDNEDFLRGSPAQSTLPKSTLKVIDLIMRKIEVNLRHAAYKHCTNNYTSNSRGEISSSQTHRKSSQSSGPKRKSRNEGSPPPDDNEDDGPSKRRRGSAATVESSDTGARFACPFYKHDPDRYRNRRTCPGPGWPTVHRMKEHLYRSHSQPIFCPICYSTFKSDKDQSNHVRLQQCQRSDPQNIEGIDRETVFTLRKRTTASRLEEDKWRDVYHVLFPEVSEADIPSPFYDCDSPTETSRRFRRDLLRRVQEELHTTAAQVSNPVEQQLLQRVAAIIQRCESELLNRNANGVPSAPDSPSARRRSDSSAGSSRQANSHVDVVPIPPDAVPAPAPQHHDHDDVPQRPGYEAFPFTTPLWDDAAYTGLDWYGIFEVAPDVVQMQMHEEQGCGVMARPMFT